MFPPAESDPESRCPVYAVVPNLFGTRDSFMENGFSMDQGIVRGWFGHDSSALHLLCTLFLL